jgi:hypothetical protein
MGRKSTNQFRAELPVAKAKKRSQQSRHALAYVRSATMLIFRFLSGKNKCWTLQIDNWMNGKNGSKDLFFPSPFSLLPFFPRKLIGRLSKNPGEDSVTSISSPAKNDAQQMHYQV